MGKDNERLDKHSATGVSGDAKKGGHKGWGKPRQDNSCPAAIDKNDPNYVSDEEN